MLYWVQYTIIKSSRENTTSQRGDTKMRTYEEMVAEFNLRADKAVYNKGDKLVNERIKDEFPNLSMDEYSDIEEELARGAYEDDGYTKLGQLTPEEIYFLLVEHYTYDEANDYLTEIEYYEIKRVA